MSNRIVENVTTCNRNDRGIGSIWRVCIAWVFIIIFIILSSGSGAALSNSSDGNWLYYRNLSIDNPGDVLTDYQILVNLTGINFPDSAQPDGADIRFTDTNGLELNYWIESWNNSTKNAKIWVNVTRVPERKNTILRMYYGNTNASSSSNGNTVFDFFDDFEDSKIDLAKWREYDLNSGLGSVTESDGVMKLTVTTQGETPPVLPSIQSFQDGILEFKGKVVSTKNVPHIIGKFRYDGLSSGEVTIRGGGHNDLYFYDQGSIGKIAYENLDTHLNEWHFIQVRFNGDEASLYVKNLVTGLEGSTSGILITTKSNPIGLSVWNTDSIDYFDDVRVRKYAYPEPTVSIGDETKITKDFTFAHITDVHIGYYPTKVYCLYNLSSIKCTPQNMKNSIEIFTDTLQAIKKVAPDFIVVTGDLVEYSEKDFFIAFRNLLRDFDVPFKITPGNHDRRDWKFFDDALSNYNTYIKPESNPSSIDNNYFFDFEGYRFIGLDSGADYSQQVDAERKSYDITPEADGLSDNQMITLNTDFNIDSPKIIFMHHPIISSGNDSLIINPITGSILWGVPHDGAPGGNDGTIAFNRYNFINYTKDNNVQLVLTGHRHKNAIFDITGNSAANNSNNRPLFIQTQNRGYRLIEVKDGMVNPYDVAPALTFNRISGAVDLNLTDIPYRFGIHAYDSQGRHTGMKTDCSDFELGIPNSYYTGDYGWFSVTPQVIVGYSDDINIKEIKKFRLFAPRCLISGLSKTTEGISQATADISQATEYSPYLGNISFNLTIKDQTEASTIEINFYNINATERSNATVDVDTATNYTMYLDFDGDGITDQLVNPDSIYITPAHPKSNITILLYDGARTINLSTDQGNISTAASLKDLSLPGKPYDEFIYGLFSFNISDLSEGQSINITIPLPQSLPSNTRYWNYGRIIDSTSSYWYQVPVISNGGNNQIIIQVQDGGIGDEDLTANGAILSTGGPGIPLSDTEVKGFAIGGGWIYTDAENTLPENKAHFEFEVKYKGDVSTGNLNFKIEDASIDLKSKSIDWLDISDTAIRFQGTGTINGEGSYNFLVTGIDNGEPGKGIDYFDINIWNNIDTQANFRYNTRGTLAGGNIAIHQK